MAQLAQRLSAVGSRRVAVAAAAAGISAVVHCAAECDSSTTLMRASGKLPLRPTVTGCSKLPLVTVQGSIDRATLAAQELLTKHLSDFHARCASVLTGSGQRLQPLRVSLLGPEAQHGAAVAVEFPLPPTADATAVLATLLGATSLEPVTSTPLQRLFGSFTLTDALERADYKLQDGVHRTTVTTDTGVVVLQRDLFSGAESLRLTTAGSELGGPQARALASAYEVAHRPPQPLRTEDDSLVSHAGVEESSMGYGGGSA